MLPVLKSRCGWCKPQRDTLVDRLIDWTPLWVYDKVIKRYDKLTDPLSRRWHRRFHS